MNAFLRTLALALPLAVAAPAFAQPFKCKGPDGKILYSDQRCPDAPNKPAAAPVAAAPAPGGLTDAQRERVAALEAATKATGTTDDQRWAARLEINAIRSGVDAKLTAEERAKRDSLVTELGGADKKRRTAAMDELRWFYNNR